MAFSIKKKRMANPTQEQTENQATEQPQEAGEIPNEIIFGGTSEKSNVVATQSWVYKILKGFWNWTKFFATRNLQVAGPVHAERVETVELKTNDAYATKLTLIDPNGRPGVVYINEAGELKIDYDFQNVYFYPGDGRLDIRKFVYRSPNVAASFVGLTPYETFLNFVPFESMQQKEFNGKVCNKICQADGVDENIEGTFLIQCNQARRIAAVKILDSDGELLDTISIPSNDVRMLTINMPSFKQSNEEGGESVKIDLPAGKYNTQNVSLVPFVPPFLKPLPPPHPQFGMFNGLNQSPPPPPPMPSNDIFDDSMENEGDLFVDDLPYDSPNTTLVDGGYDVLYETYSTDTYCNIRLKRSDFTKNQEQYLMVETVDA